MAKNKTKPRQKNTKTTSKKGRKKFETIRVASSSAAKSSGNGASSHRSHTTQGTSPRILTAHFPSGPPAVTDNLTFKSFIDKNAPVNGNNVVVVGQNQKQAYRSLTGAAADNTPKHGLIGLYDPETKKIHFQKSSEVTMSHAEIRSEEYMKRMFALSDLITERHQMNPQDKLKEIRLAYGDKKTKNKSTRNTYGLTMDRTTVRIVRQGRTKISNYNRLPFALPGVNVEGNTPRAVYPFEEIFSMIKTEVSNLTYDENWYKDIVEGSVMKRMAVWLVRTRDSHRVPPKTVLNNICYEYDDLFKQNPMVYKCFMLYYALSYLATKWQAEDPNTKSSLPKKDETRYVEKFIGKELLERLEAWCSIPGRWSLRMLQNYRCVSLALVAALYLCHARSNKWMIILANGIAKDFHISMNDLVKIASANGIFEHTRDVHTLSYRVGEKFVSIFEESMLDTDNAKSRSEHADAQKKKKRKKKASKKSK